MNNNKVLLIVSIVLLGVAAYFYYNNNGSTFKQELTDFAVEDTASVTRIFLADQEGTNILLDRNSDGVTWTLNGKYDARKDAVTLLLKTMHKVEVKSPVPLAMEENVIKRLSSKGIKVEVYEKNKHKKAAKVYYVGGGTKDGYGTFMLLENSSKPFITYIKNNRGTLTPRYFLDESAWRDTKILAVPSSEIKSITVEHIENKENSFIINNIDAEKKQFELSSINNKALQNIDTLEVMDYITRFEKLHFEFFPPIPAPQLQDSLTKNEHIFNLIVTDKSDNKYEVKGFRSPPFDDERIDNNTGEPFLADPDRLFLKVEGLENWVIGQYFVFDPLIVTANSFVKN